MRRVALVAIALAAVWFGFVDNDWLDRRPVHRLLFLGHSRTYGYQVPLLVRRMADSAGSKVRYDITVQAFPGASAEDHWNNAKTQALLAQHNWDKVVIQPEGVWRNDEPIYGGFFVYSKKLLAAGAGKEPPAIIVNWGYGDSIYPKFSTTREEHFEANQSAFRGVANQMGAQLINVAPVWRDVSAENLPFPLFSDDIHSTLEGAYLAALVIYAELAHTDVADVSYVPSNMSSNHAALLREKVQNSLRVNRLAGFASAE